MVAGAWGGGAALRIPAAAALLVSLVLGYVAPLALRCETAVTRSDFPPAEPGGGLTLRHEIIAVLPLVNIGG